MPDAKPKTPQETPQELMDAVHGKLNADGTRVSEPDYSRRAVGVFASDYFAGKPVDWAKSQVLDRAGVPQKSDLRQTLKFTHASLADNKDVPTISADFSLAGMEGKFPVTVGDYLSVIDAVPKMDKTKATDAHTPTSGQRQVEDAQKIAADEAREEYQAIVAADVAALAAKNEQ